MSNKKEIIALDQHEHVRLRPTMWISSVEQTDEKVPIIKDGLLIEETKKLSVGFYKLMNEIIDNAFDESKRMKNPMDSITVEFDSMTSRVTVTDTGDGFYKGTEINSKTGMTNIESAVATLQAGSNFFNQDDNDSLIGTNGVGASIVNILSEEFTIVTTNKDFYFEKTWKDFKGGKSIIRKRKKTDKLGTSISFIPLSKTKIRNKTIKLFEDCVLDKDYVYTQMCFRNFLKNNDEKIKDIKFDVYFDGKKLDLDINFLPKETIKITNKLGTFILWEKYDDSISISFINGAECTGIHQKIFNDWINDDVFNFNSAHHYYDTLIMLNFQPKFVRFKDQNKTRYDGTRSEIEELLQKRFYNKTKGNLKKSKIFDRISKTIEERIFKDEMNKIKRKKRNIKRVKISDKYTPPAKNNDTIFITEGNSAAFGILQRRDSDKDGVYALRGKIKNAKSIRDLSSNKEIIDIMEILGIDPENDLNCRFNKVVIATDADPDGIGHIASLLIHLFYRWFPNIIRQNRLYLLITPVVAAKQNSKDVYFYSMKDYKDSLENKATVSNVRYLKGLGSLEIEDWEYVMEQRRMFRIYKDNKADELMDIAFGNSTQKRKEWLKG